MITYLQLSLSFIGILGSIKYVKSFFHLQEMQSLIGSRQTSADPKPLQNTELSDEAPREVSPQSNEKDSSLSQKSEQVHEDVQAHETDKEKELVLSPEDEVQEVSANGSKGDEHVEFQEGLGDSKVRHFHAA